MKRFSAAAWLLAAALLAGVTGSPAALARSKALTPAHTNSKAEVVNTETEPARPVDGDGLDNPNERVGSGEIASVANGATASDVERQMVALVNQERQKAGLQPLAINSGLTLTARTKSYDMVQNNYFSHQSPKLGSPFDQMNAAGIKYWTAGRTSPRPPALSGPTSFLCRAPVTGRTS